MNKVHLILVDGMRPDALEKCSNPYIKELLGKSLYSLKAQTVFPSVTLPCHMSLFHSVEPTRHGVSTNTYMPQVRPINGICEQLKLKGRRSAMFYNWPELRDLTRPGSVMYDVLVAGFDKGYEYANEKICAAAINCVKTENPDFCFTYLGWTDEAGHGKGWMGEEYLHSIDESFKCIEKIIDAVTEDCITIIVADHGGHDRTHGTLEPEDMLIPVIIYGKDVTPGVIDKEISIMDIAPTVTKLLECDNAPEWEGKSIL